MSQDASAPAGLNVGESDSRGAPGESVAKSAVLMVAGSACFVGLAALVKLASDEATPMQAVLYRSVFSALPVWAVMRARAIPVRSRKWRLLALRGGLGFCALYCYLWSVVNIPLVDVLTLQQMAPIFVALLSMMLLGERPRAMHYVLASVCFGGALLIIRPTRGLASLGSSVALLSALFSSGAYVTVRALTRTEATERIVLWFSLCATLLALPLVIPSWHPLSSRSQLLLVGAGLAAALAQSLMTASYRRAPAHVASAFSYASVPCAYVTGLLLWGEHPDSLSNAGILVIAAGGVALVLSAGRGRARADPTQSP